MNMANLSGSPLSADCGVEIGAWTDVHVPSLSWHSVKIGERRGVGT
jgi:hypothetical protein